MHKKVKMIEQFRSINSIYVEALNLTLIWVSFLGFGFEVVVVVVGVKLPPV